MLTSANEPFIELEVLNDPQSPSDAQIFFLVAESSHPPSINIPMSVVHIFRIPQVVELTTATGAPLMNYPVNRTDFNLARYVDNEIEFWVKNIDRRAVSLTGAALTMHISDPHNNRVLLTRELTVLDAAKGLVRMYVTGDEAASMPKGNLRYSIVMQRSDGVQTMLYTDRDRKGIGHIQVIDGPLPDPIEATNIDLGLLITVNGKLTSSPYPGAAEVHNLSGQHSAVVEFNEFVGILTIQGTLEPQPSQTGWDWFDVKVVECPQPTTERRHIPFEGNLSKVRFVVQKISGNIDGIQYRT